MQKLDAKRRGLKPVDDQLVQSRARLNHLQEKHKKEAKAAQGTEQHITELQIKLAEQLARAAATAAEIDSAKGEISLLNLAAAAEAAGSGQPGSMEGARPPAADALLQGDTATRKALSDFCA